MPRHGYSILPLRISARATRSRRFYFEILIKESLRDGDASDPSKDPGKLNPKVGRIAFPFEFGSREHNAAKGKQIEVELAVFVRVSLFT